MCIYIYALYSSTFVYVVFPTHMLILSSFYIDMFTCLHDIFLYLYFLEAVKHLVKLKGLFLKGTKLKGHIDACKPLVNLTTLNLTGTYVQGDIEAFKRSRALK